MRTSTAKRKELLAKSLVGDWRDRNWVYLDSATHASTAFHERMKQRRAMVPIKSVVRV